jgi:hypothetical protein
MKIHALLPILLMSACTKPVQVPVPAAASKPTCFAPAGSYVAFVKLRKHECGFTPKDTLSIGLEVGPDSVPCGRHVRQAVLRSVSTSLEIDATRTGMSGRMFARLPGCLATYDVVFLRVK